MGEVQILYEGCPARHLELRIEFDFTDFNVVLSPLLKVVQSCEGQAFVFFITLRGRRQVVTVVMLLEVVPGLLLGDRTTALRGELLLQNGVKIHFLTPSFFF